jgi:hypothetical protein
MILIKQDRFLPLSGAIMPAYDVEIYDQNGNVRVMQTADRNPQARGDLFRQANNTAVSGETIVVGYGVFDTGAANPIITPVGVNLIGRGMDATKLINGWPDLSFYYCNFEATNNNFFSDLTMEISGSVNEQTVVAGWSSQAPQNSTAWWRRVRMNATNFGAYCWGGGNGGGTGRGMYMHLDQCEINTSRWAITAGLGQGGPETGKIFVTNCELNVDTSLSAHTGIQNARGIAVAIRGMGTYIKNTIMRVSLGDGSWYDPSLPGIRIVPMIAGGGVYTMNADPTNGDSEGGNRYAIVEVSDCDILVDHKTCPYYADVYERMVDVVKVQQNNIGSVYNDVGQNRLRDIDWKTDYYVP